MAQFRLVDPDYGYITDNLLIPKEYINVTAIKAALTFDITKGKDIERHEIWSENDTHIIVPRHFIGDEELRGLGFDVVDETPTSFPEAAIGSRITLRGKQQEALDTYLRSDRCGTLNIRCGGGKTVIALQISAEKKVNTLIIVNTTALLEQWLGEINRHLDVEGVGIIQGSVMDWRGRPIVMAMLHTLARKAQDLGREFREYFGQVIFDEAHHMSAPVFMQCADICRGARLSLTATAQRTDGLEAIYQYHLGPVVFKDLEQELVPETIFHYLSYQLSQDENWAIQDRAREVNMSKVRSFLGRLEWRNFLILDLLQADLDAGRNILALTHSRPHAEELYRIAPWPNKGLITGKTDQSERMGILRDKNPIFGTFQLGREGLDKPALDTLHILTPFSNANDLQQSWGRTQREYEGKMNPLVRVLEDGSIGLCMGSCRSMRKILRALRYPFRTEKVEDCCG